MRSSESITSTLVENKLSAHTNVSDGGWVTVLELAELTSQPLLHLLLLLQHLEQDSSLILSNNYVAINMRAENWSMTNHNVNAKLIKVVHILVLNMRFFDRIFILP